MIRGTLDHRFVFTCVRGGRTKVGHAQLLSASSTCRPILLVTQQNNA